MAYINLENNLSQIQNNIDHINNNKNRLENVLNSILNDLKIDDVEELKIKLANIENNIKK